jgi:hypothetical protein
MVAGASTREHDGFPRIVHWSVIYGGRSLSLAYMVMVLDLCYCSVICLELWS